MKGKLHPSLIIVVVAIVILIVALIVLTIFDFEREENPCKALADKLNGTVNDYYKFYGAIRCNIKFCIEVGEEIQVGNNTWKMDCKKWEYENWELE